MNKHTPNPHSITLLSWHLANVEKSKSEDPKDAKIEQWLNDSRLVPVPSLLLSAS